MKNAIAVFAELQDATAYALKDWLRLPLEEADQAEITNLNAAAAFLFDRFFAKENAGSDITAAAREELKDQFDPHKLSLAASELLTRTKGLDLEKDGSPFSEYYRFIVRTENYIRKSLEDEQGLLALVYIERFVMIVMKAHRDQSPLRVGEIAFVNLTSSWRLIYKGFYKERFASLKSFPYFDGVEEAAEQIRSAINE